MAKSTYEQRAIFSTLLDPFLSYSGIRGEVPSLFYERVAGAEKGLAAETEAVLVPFWDWHLNNVQADLKREVESVKEEAGE